MRTDLCSCLGHLQNGCEAMANSLLVLMPHEQTHGAFSILKQIGILSPDGTKARAVKNVVKLMANSLSVAKVAPTEMAGEAGPNKPASHNCSDLVVLAVLASRRRSLVTHANSDDMRLAELQRSSKEMCCGKPRHACANACQDPTPPG